VVPSITVADFEVYTNELEADGCSLIELDGAEDNTGVSAADEDESEGGSSEALGWLLLASKLRSTLKVRSGLWIALS